MSAPSTSLWRRWVDRPQRVWLRRALFQIHLWLALGLGLYIVMISLTGSAVVFRREFSLWMVPRSVPAAVGTPLSGDDLRHAVERAYPSQTVVAVREPRRRDRPVSVTLERAGKTTDRLFDQYAVKDLGSSFPPFLRTVEWLVDLHDNLLGGETGRAINGVAALLVTGVLVSGVVIWWSNVSLVQTKLSGANLTGCRVYGVSAWDLDLKGAIQDTLIVTAIREKNQVSVDNLEVARCSPGGVGPFPLPSSG